MRCLNLGRISTDSSLTWSNQRPSARASDRPPRGKRFVTEGQSIIGTANRSSQLTPLSRLCDHVGKSKICPWVVHPYLLAGNMAHSITVSTSLLLGNSATVQAMHLHTDECILFCNLVPYAISGAVYSGNPLSLSHGPRVDKGL
jgi:hypothetical protein